MPLINKAAVIFISQGLQTRLWYVAWQQKWVKSACSYQISKVLIPSCTATNLKFQGAEATQLLSQPHHPPLPLPRTTRSNCRHRRNKLGTIIAPSSKGCKKGWEVVSLEFQVNFLFSFQYCSLPYFPQPFSPITISLLSLISLFVLCCRLRAQ